MRFQVTLYGNDTNELICSSDVTLAAGQGKCYNSSWQYYSVDMCTPLVPSSTTTLLSISSTTTNPTSTATSSNSVNVAALAGGSVAGTLVIIAVIATAGYCFWWKSKVKKIQQTRAKNAERDKEMEITAVLEKLAMTNIAEAPWQSQRPWELTPDHIVEAPSQSPRDVLAWLLACCYLFLVMFLV